MPERSPLGHGPTSNRAELRAAIGALTIRFLPGEGFCRLVITTDSDYVFKGATERVEKRKPTGGPHHLEMPSKIRIFGPYFLTNQKIGNGADFSSSFSIFQVLVVTAR
ncbi:SubName: Full=Uncharacterized protein {ECO:0000313/EMBL:CCA76443.1} [Serendipita indica DSM 11827]|uniref:RNase H type-1 domain-containing protein n=1 Tax=Serendipita indica (strain DSM 11827) TaxID=1109443 RepID=G4TYQ0_SERID|nr:SubName: Full=Uncharacterized protein {ECO:0000313/EMBL:CCA76443.1} [Serendipita indica DSM 11827]CCA76443.1 hypothetical protein PIIN_10436 [Serendipita indica DSM 11827]